MSFHDDLLMRYNRRFFPLHVAIEVQLEIRIVNAYTLRTFRLADGRGKVRDMVEAYPLYTFDNDFMRSFAASRLFAFSISFLASICSASVGSGAGVEVGSSTVFFSVT